jgi:hypothetical protein
MKVLCIAACVALSTGLGCGQGGSSAAGFHGAANLHVLDKEIPNLASGLSVEEVEGRIGSPKSASELEGGEVALYYGHWRLYFDPGLRDRVRSYKAGYWPEGRPVAELDREVRGVDLKSSIDEVEQELGRPGSWQIVLPGRKEKLWYGPGRWELVFSRGNLVGKVLHR